MKLQVKNIPSLKQDVAMANSLFYRIQCTVASYKFKIIHDENVKRR